jgi:hypothetical protein
VISRDVEWGHGQQMLEIDVSFDVGSFAIISPFVGICWVGE